MSHIRHAAARGDIGDRQPAQRMKADEQLSAGCAACNPVLTTLVRPPRRLELGRQSLFFFSQAVRLRRAAVLTRTVPAGNSRSSGSTSTTTTTNKQQQQTTTTTTGSSCSRWELVLSRFALMPVALWTHEEETCSWQTTRTWCFIMVSPLQLVFVLRLTLNYLIFKNDNNNNDNNVNLNYLTLCEYFIVCTLHTGDLTLALTLCFSLVSLSKKNVTFFFYYNN